MGESSPRLVANKIIQGDALSKLKELESESIDTCITSPPYWALRDYKVDGQLGLEPTFQEYVEKLVGIFDEVKRVLKKTGSCWVVIGDTYSSKPTGTWNGGSKAFARPSHKFGIAHSNEIDKSRSNIPEKSLCMIPERFSISMVDHGWILRNKIIWYKPNCMPSSAKDRFTVDWEYVYFFTKSQRYFFETQYEPLMEPDRKRGTKNDVYGGSKKHDGYNNPVYSGNVVQDYNPLGRIKRCVWKISTKPFSAQKLLADYVGADGKLYRASPNCPIHRHLASQRETDNGGKSDKCVCSSKIPDHFAVFPPDLVLPMLKAGCPEYICNKCGKARKLEYEETKILNPRPALNNKNGYEINYNKRRDQTNRSQTIRMPKFGGNRAAEYGPRVYSGKEWNPSIKQQDGMTDCGCNTGFHSGVVLDPFFGAGTVGLVALQNGRDFVGIELNPDYIQIANTRLNPLLNQQKL